MLCGVLIHPPTPFTQACFVESSSTIPLLFVLSPGTDPSAALLRFAEETSQKGRVVKLQVRGMGGGRGRGVYAAGGGGVDERQRGHRHGGWGWGGQ